MSDVLIVKNVNKTFSTSNGELKVLNNINFSLSEGTTLSIIGPSGSGKSTLLGICAGLDLPTSGTVSLNGISLDKMDEDDRAYMRNQYVGFIFQNFQLFPTLTALENISIPLEIRGDKNYKKKANDLLEKVGLTDRDKHYPSQLSGGEQQRVAIARAFINNPKILFADEPTGNLDEETASIIENTLFELNEKQKTTLVIITHNNELASRTNRILTIKGGELIENNDYPK